MRYISLNLTIHDNKLGPNLNQQKRSFPNNSYLRYECVMLAMSHARKSLDFSSDL
jgi:hypothetical protein